MVMTHSKTINRHNIMGYTKVCNHPEPPRIIPHEFIWILVLIILENSNFSNRRQSLWIIVGCCGWLWVVVDYCGWLWMIVGGAALWQWGICLRSIVLVLTSTCSTMTVCDNFWHFWLILGQLWIIAGGFTWL